MIKWLRQQYSTMPIPVPSRLRAITRTAAWISTVDTLPEDVAKHIPSQDPIDDKDQILKSVRLIEDFGVEGAEAVDKYIAGQISEEELEKQLDDCARSTNEHKQVATSLKSKLVKEF